MYGTVAHMKANAGKAEELIALQQEMSSRKPPGMVAVYVYRLDSNPDEFMLVAMFKDKESYIANAQSPDQDEEYRRMRALLEADPHWHDGEVVQSIT